MNHAARGGFLALLLVVPIAGCHRAVPNRPTSTARYVVAAPWRGERGVWFYPDARFGGTIGGIAVPWTVRAGQIAFDGAPLDPSVPAAAVQSLQLPVVLRVFNPANGLSLLLRADDRGPADPARLVALDDAASRALGVGGPTPVIVTIDATRSQSLADALGGIPRASGTAPVEGVSATPLGPPGAAPAASPAAVRTGAAPPASGLAAPLPSLPTAAVRGATVSFALYLDGGTFSDGTVAREIAARIDGRALAIGGGRERSWRVLAGPFPSVASADAALDRAIGAGLSGARITVVTDSDLLGDAE